MSKLNMKAVENFVEKEISVFHARRLEYLESKVDLKKILKQKNPYLFRAKNVLTAQELIDGFLSAFLQSQEETLFGDFMEKLAIFVCHQVYGGKKSELTGLDLEFEKDGKIYIVEIKTGFNWGNSSQLKQLKINFAEAKKLLHNQFHKEVVAINGCCFGIDNKPEKAGYYKLCGQRFWELISGNENLYVDIIEPIGYRAKQKNDDFWNAYSNLINKLTLEFGKTFCKGNGAIDWEKLVKFNSGKKTNDAATTN